MQDHERTDRGDLANAMRRIRFDAHHVGRLLEGCAEERLAFLGKKALDGRRGRLHYLHASLGRTAELRLDLRACLVLHELDEPWTGGLTR